MARVVIADAGPLIAFAGIDQLTVSHRLFAEISIVRAVKDECLAKPGKDSERINAAIADGWLIVHILSKDSLPLSPSLGLGESESIQLAMEQADQSLLILDDRLARRFARKQNLSIIGTVRLLDLAEQHGLIESAEHSIQQLRQIGYRISIELLQMIR